MVTATFDALGYFDKLKAVGVPEEQARVQAEALREYSAIQEENARRELATKMDLAQMEMRLNEKIEGNKHEILKWIMGMLIAQTAFLATAISYLR